MTKENWTDIHEDFGKRQYYPNTTYQQFWEDYNFTYQEVQEWIGIGLTPEEFKFASYLKQNNYQPHNLPKTIEELRKEYWLDRNYPKQTKEIKIGSSTKFHGTLIIANYPQLEEIEIRLQKNLTNLQISNCPKLKELVVWSSQLTHLNINHLKDLEELDVSENNLTELNLSNLVGLKSLNCSFNNFTNLILPQSDKLEYLVLSNSNLNQDLFFLSGLAGLKRLYLSSNKFKGSLRFLKDMSKLEELDISSTDIGSGLEYLPESIERFYCSVNKRLEAKVKTIYDLFANNQGEVEEFGTIKNFPQKLKAYKQWRNLDFTEGEVKEWTKVGLKLNEFEFANYLRQKNYQPNTPNIQEIIQKESWRDIYEDFDYQLRKNWESKNFSKGQTQEWISVGAKANDYEFIAWLKELKKETPQWITTYQEDYEILSERFKKYGLCLECNQPNTGEKWCQNCNSKRLKQNFKNWTSKNPQIDKFIQKYQLEATETNKFIEWIPYEEFIDIEYLAEGGFGKVYKTWWVAGNILHWDNENNRWKRDYKAVVLKNLNNSSTNTDFLDETAKHKIIDDWFNNIVPCYGLSQDPKTGNYLMVMQYIEGGDLRKYLKNSKNLSFQDKLQRLANIAQGLKDIHSKNLVHRDFHSGNILSEVNKFYITDLGLCKPTDEINKEEKDEVYGVLPYVAPEVLNGNSSRFYTSKSDIYSFGIVAYEIFANASPYLDRKYDKSLALDIVCDNLRPNLEELKIPQLLKNLIQKCWNADPNQRPTANELEKTLRNWQKDTEFVQRLQAVEAEYNKISQNMDYRKHPTEKLTSCLLSSKNLSKSQKPWENNIHNLLSTDYSSVPKSTSEYHSREQDFDIDAEDLINKTKRQLSLETQAKVIQGDPKLPKIIEEQTFQTEPESMEIDSISNRDWRNIHPDFTLQLVQNWQSLGFAYEQTQDWINIGLQPTDYSFCSWLRDKNYTAEQILNHRNLETLQQEFIQSQQTPQIIHNPPKQN